MSDSTGADEKAPQRSVDEIIADIERERSELDRSFDALRKDLGEALDAGKQKAKDSGKKAVVGGSVIAALVVTAAVTRSWLRRRSAREG